jgi:hypothetical protein
VDVIDSGTSSLSSGIVNVNTEPTSGWLLTEIAPPRSCANRQLPGWESTWKSSVEKQKHLSS